jgi:hypothetical protein
MTITAIGAAEGAVGGDTNTGGLGGSVSATVTGLTAGETLYIRVGQAGTGDGEPVSRLT